MDGPEKKLPHLHNMVIPTFTVTINPLEDDEVTYEVKPPATANQSPELKSHLPHNKILTPEQLQKSIANTAWVNLWQRKNVIWCVNVLFQVRDCQEDITFTNIQHCHQYGVFNSKIFFSEANSFI